jgi:hypothetical protein
MDLKKMAKQIMPARKSNAVIISFDLLLMPEPFILFAPTGV